MGRYWKSIFTSALELIPLTAWSNVPTMKEVFRNADSVLVGFYQSILEEAGIQTFVGNTSSQQALVAGIMTAFFPLPLFFPVLYVLNDADYVEAMTILRDLKNAPAAVEAEWTCQNCGQPVPGNFTTCWKCLASKSDDTVEDHKP